MWNFNFVKMARGTSGPEALNPGLSAYLQYFPSEYRISREPSNIEKKLIYTITIISQSLKPEDPSFSRLRWFPSTPELASSGPQHLSHFAWLSCILWSVLYHIWHTNNLLCVFVIRKIWSPKLSMVIGCRSHNKCFSALWSRACCPPHVRFFHPLPN